MYNTRPIFSIKKSVEVILYSFIHSFIHSLICRLFLEQALCYSLPGGSIHIKSTFLGNHPGCGKREIHEDINDSIIFNTKIGNSLSV